MEAARRLVFQAPADRRPSHADTCRAAYKAFIREWGDNPAFEDHPKSFENTFSALAFYLEQHPPATDIVQPLIREASRGPAVEFTFSIPIEEGPRHPETGDPFLFAGRFDLLGSYGGLPCVVDEKTTYAIGYSWESQFDLRGQFLGYIWACQHYGFDLNTAVVRGIGIQKRDTKLATAIKQYPQYLIDRWYQQLLLDLFDVEYAWKAHQLGEAASIHYPYNFSDACTSYGGCAYAALCAASDPEPFFSNYHHYRWNPLAKQPIEELSNGN